MLSGSGPRLTSLNSDLAVGLPGLWQQRRCCGKGRRILPRALASALLAALCISVSTAHAAGFFDKLKNELEEAFEGVIREETKEALDDTTEIIKDKSQEPVEPIPEKSEHVETDSPRYDRLWIREIQTHLEQLGYNPGPADGIYGDVTRRTLERFQQDAGLPVTGLPTPLVMEALRASSQSPPLAQPAPATPNLSSTASSPPAGNKSQSVLVFEAQDRLNQLGYDAGQPDGKYGSKTATAVRAFQSDNNLPADGQVTQNLIVALRDPRASHRSVPAVASTVQPTIAAPASDASVADAAFRQLPEEIQNRIIDEATEYQSECSMGTKLRAFYNCDCVREEYIKNRTVQGPNVSGRSLYREAKNACIAPRSIAKYQYLSCEETYRNIKDFESLCECYSKTWLKKYMLRPSFSLDFHSLLTRESYKECDALSYRGRVKTPEPKFTASEQSREHSASQSDRPAPVAPAPTGQVAGGPDPDEAQIRESVQSSDDFLKYEEFFVRYSTQLVSQGRCKVADFKEFGGWKRSTDSAHRNDPIYMTDCGPPGRDKRRWYLMTKYRGMIFN